MSVLAGNKKAGRAMNRTPANAMKLADASLLVNGSWVKRIRRKYAVMASIETRENSPSEQPNK